MEFGVVKFLQSNVVDVVPCSWLYEDKCYWPPKTISATVLPHREKKIAPAEYWDLYEVHTLGLFETYAAAVKKLRIAQVRSDLESTDSEDLGKGKRIKYKLNGNYDESSDDSEDIISNTPQIQRIKGLNCNKENREPVIERISADIGVMDDSLTFSTYPERQSESLLGQPQMYTPSSSPLNVNNKTEGYLKAILRNQISIKSRLKNIEDNIMILVTKIHEIANDKSSGNGNHPSDVLKLLPISTLENFLEVEEKLANDVIKNQMVSYLQKIGGGNHRHAITLIMKKMLSNAFAATFSYLGQRGKHCFKSSKLCKIIFDAVITNPLFAVVTEDEVCKVIAEWLRHAKARSERRKSIPVT